MVLSKQFIWIWWSYSHGQTNTTISIIELFTLYTTFQESQNCIIGIFRTYRSDLHEQIFMLLGLGNFNPPKFGRPTKRFAKILKKCRMNSIWLVWTDATVRQWDVTLVESGNFEPGRGSNQVLTCLQNKNVSQPPYKTHSNIKHDWTAQSEFHCDWSSGLCVILWHIWIWWKRGPACKKTTKDAVLCFQQRHIGQWGGPRLAVQGCFQ